jgi:hypothetical protein
MTTNGKNTRIASDKVLIEGTRKHPGKGDIIHGRSYSAKDIMTILRARVEASVAVQAARAEWQLKVREERETLEQTDKLIGAYRQMLFIKYAVSENILADFGLAPRKARRAQTTVEKMESVARAKSTREARHTLGRRQKARIHGDTDVSVVVATGASATAGGGTSTPSGGSPPSPAPVPPAPAPVPHVPAHVPPPLLPPANGAS